MAVAAQNAPAQFRRESAIARPKINIFDWTYFQVLQEHKIHIITSLELDWS